MERELGAVLRSQQLMLERLGLHCLRRDCGV